MKLKFFICCFLALLGMGDSAFSQSNGRFDAWKYVGIGGGGAMFYPTFSPFDSNLIFIACDMGGGYVTYDGGRSWRMFNLSGTIRFYVFDPNDQNTVYACATGLYRSRDKGKTWSLIYPVAEEFVGFTPKGDHGDNVLVTTDSTERKVLALAIDPADPAKLYAGISIGKEVGLYYSPDAGSHWLLEKKLGEGVKKIFIHPASPNTNRELFVVGSNRIVIRKKGRWSVHTGPELAGQLTEITGGFDAKSGSMVIYAVASNGSTNNVPLTRLYKTVNGGQSWVAADHNLVKRNKPGAPLPEWRTITSGEKHPNVIYCSFHQLTAMDNSILAGVAKSSDFGKTWEIVWQDRQKDGIWKAAENFSKDWLNDRFGPTWGENPLCLGVSPIDPNLAIGTDFGRTIKTSNGGKTWEQVYSREVSPGTWASTGLEVTTGYTIAFDPFDAKHVYLANTDIGLLESNDATNSWVSATKDNGIPENWANTCYWLLFDPAVPGKAWAVMSGVHDLPRPKMFRRTGVSDYSGGIVMTVNSGKSWQAVSQDIGEAAMTHIILDPTSAPASRILYSCAFGKGVYKSTDGGLHWVQKNKGLEGREPFAWQITRRESDGVLFLVVSRRSEDGSIGNAGDGALYRSVDGAESWQPVALPAGTNAPTSLGADHEDPKKLVLSAWGRKMPGAFSGDSGGGIFVSRDDGKSWQVTLDKDQHISDISFDKRSGRYYACGFEGSAYFSADGGGSWTRIRGYNFKWGKRVEPDPKDPEKIYIITFGGGVWYGPATGDPTAVEDIIPAIK